MSRAPAFQFYANDFMDATRLWDANACGLYVRCMCIQWTHGSIPADLKVLARAIHCDLAELQSVWPVVGPKFIDQGDGTLKNKRLEEVRERQQQVSSKRSEAAKARWEAHAFADANAMQLHLQRKVKVKKKVEGEQEGVKGEGSPVDDVFAAFWQAYPSKKAKGHALKAWAKLTAEERGKCLPAIQAQVAAKHFKGSDGVDYIPHPATWLNARRWEDELAQVKQTTPVATGWMTVTRA